MEITERRGECLAEQRLSRRIFRRVPQLTPCSSRHVGACLMDSEEATMVASVQIYQGSILRQLKDSRAYESPPIGETSRTAD